MAQRFGGKFSPTGDGQTAGRQSGGHPKTAPVQANAFDGKRPTKAGFKSNFLFVMPFLFAWKAFGGTPGALILGLCAFGLMLFGAWMTREGLFAEEAYEARKVARRPALPRKITGGAAIGLGLALFAAGTGQNILISGLLGVMGAALHLISFGLDPLHDKGTEGIDSYQTDRVARAVDTAESHLARMKDAILRTRDRQLETRVDHFISIARALFRTVEDDPRDLTAARKYLGIYLKGAAEATAKFADLYTGKRDPAMRADYIALLDDLETNFASRTTALLADDHSDLNVEIDVLRERLKFES